MTENFAFQPDWASPPGDTISDFLHEKHISISEFTQRMGYSFEFITKLLQGEKSVDKEVARKLELTLGSSIAFWLNRESQYRENLIHLKEEADLRREWIKQFPITSMTKLGWISPFSNKEQRESACLDFFGVSRIKEWHDTYANYIEATAFRTSKSFDSEAGAVIAWLRQGEIQSDLIVCDPWNGEKLTEILHEVRSLTREKNPEVFIPEAQILFAKCGVALVIVPAPNGCRASGATYFTSPEKALVLLSFRYLSDDHFWFSLFHEVGHLLLHTHKRMFLENLDVQVNKEEVEANKFSAEILVPPEYEPELKSLHKNNWRQIIRFAKSIGVSPGIIVGQLQHLELVKHKDLNSLKIRYRWK